MSVRRVEEPPLDERFALEPEADDHFRAVFEHEHPGPVFGGDILGCATRAAGESVEDKPLTSLHMRFLRPVESHEAVDFRVERIRDGRRLSHRRVVVEMNDKLCCELMLSYAAPALGPELVGEVDTQAAPRPDELPTEEERAEELGWEELWLGPFEWRWIGDVWSPRPGDPGIYFAWLRPRRPIGDDPGLRAAAIAYLSDIHSHLPVARLRGGGEHFEPHGFTSLDTVLWLHRDLDWTDWRLLVSDCEIGHGGRALSQRRLYEADGRLVVSMAQEALLLGS